MEGIGFPLKSEMPVAVLGASWLQYCGQLPHFSPQVRVLLFGCCSVCTSRAKQTGLFYSFAQCDVATFKQVIGRICLTCSFSHHGLFVCPPEPPFPPPFCLSLVLQAKG